MYPIFTEKKKISTILTLQKKVYLFVVGTRHHQADYDIHRTGKHITDGGTRNVYMPRKNPNGLVPVYRAESPFNQRLDEKVGVRYSQTKNHKDNSMVWVSIGGPPERTVEFMKQKIDERIEVYKKELKDGKIDNATFHKKVNDEKSGLGYTIRTSYISNELARRIIKGSKTENYQPKHGEKPPDVLNTDIRKAYNQFGVRGELAVEMAKEIKKNGVKVGIH